MGKFTKVDWADHSFNPWLGCQSTSPACDGCYANKWALHFKMVEFGPGKPRKRSSADTWKAPHSWNAEAARLGIRYRIFCASLGDVFDNAVPREWRDDLWALIRQTPHLDWILVTKRIGNAMGMLPPDWGAGYPNVWLMATVTTQEEAARDIPKLQAVPAIIRALSMEPLLGKVSIAKWLTGDNALDWIIVGGESGGRRARPISVDWVVSIMEECQEAGVAFFFKQWGAWIPLSQLNADNIPANKVVAHENESKVVRLDNRLAKVVPSNYLNGQLHQNYPSRILKAA